MWVTDGLGKDSKSAAVAFLFAYTNPRYTRFSGFNYLSQPVDLTTTIFNFVPKYKWSLRGTVHLPVDQMRRDKLAGLNTATFISGYEGSPLGAYDLALARVPQLLRENQIHFVPGVNEDIAATSVLPVRRTRCFPNSSRATFTVSSPRRTRRSSSLRASW